MVDPELDRTLTYEDLEVLVSKRAEVIRADASLVAILASNTVETVVDLLASARAGAAMMLLDPVVEPTDLSHVLGTYKPELVLAPPEISLEGLTCIGEGAWRSSSPRDHEVHPDLGLMLSTSGSTGSRRFVRLSRRGQLHNAWAVAESLSIVSEDVAWAHLPLYYSYGLSVLTSHLRSGATVALTRRSVLERAFWSEFQAARATSLATVPTTIAMMDRIGAWNQLSPQLRYMTVAGGRLSTGDVARVAERLDAQGSGFHVMYGQTEAGPRMACLPHDEALSRPGSVGLALADGSFAIEDPDLEGSGEILYSGPNVMLGYAESTEDLARGDEQMGLLRTGDLGRLDAEGFLYLTGRLKRMSKLNGVRISLDEVEDLLWPHRTSLGRVATVGDDEAIRVFHEFGDRETVAHVRRTLARHMRVAPLSLIFRKTQIPTLPNGKVDYQDLARRG